MKVLRLRPSKLTLWTAGLSLALCIPPVPVLAERSETAGRQAEPGFADSEADEVEACDLSALGSFGERLGAVLTLQTLDQDALGSIAGPVWGLATGAIDSARRPLCPSRLARPAKERVSEDARPGPGVCWRGAIEAEQQGLSILGTKQNWTVSLDAVFRAPEPQARPRTELELQWASYTVELNETGRKHSFVPNPYRASGILARAAPPLDPVSTGSVTQRSPGPEGPDDPRYSISTGVLDPKQDGWPLRTEQHRSTRSEEQLESERLPVLPDSLMSFLLQGEIDGGLTRMQGKSELPDGGGWVRWDLWPAPSCPTSADSDSSE